MGELPFFRAHTALHPDHLWIWEKAVYVDENQRTWLPVTIEVYRRSGVGRTGQHGRPIRGPGSGAGSPRAVQALEEPLTCRRARAAGRLRRAGPPRAAGDSQMKPLCTECKDEQFSGPGRRVGETQREARWPKDGDPVRLECMNMILSKIELLWASGF